MKILLTVLCLLFGTVYGQTIGYMRYDTVKIFTTKVGGRGSLDVTGNVRFTGLLPKSAGTDSVVVRDVNGNLGTTAKSVFTTNIYNSDGVLTGNRTLDGNGNDLTFDNIGSFFILDASSDQRIGAHNLNNKTTNIISGVTNAKSSIITLNTDSILINPSLGNLYIDTLTNVPGTRALRYNPSTGLVSYADTTTAGASGLTVGTTTITSGTNTRVLFDDAGVLGEDAGFTYVKATDALTIGGQVSIGGTGNIHATAFGTGLELGSASGYLLGLYDLTTFGLSSFMTPGGTVNVNDFQLNILGAGYASSGLFTANSIVFAARTAFTDGLKIGSETGPVHLFAGGIALTDIGLTVATNKNVGIGVTVPLSTLHIKAGSATANTAPLQLTTGAVETVIRGGLIEYNNAFYQSSSALNRYALGGAIKDFIATVDNGTTVETDLYTYTTKASTLAVDGEKLNFNIGGTFNDLTATAQLQFYFGGTNIGNTGALTVSATGGWSANILVIRTSSTTVRTLVTVTTPGASTAVYTTQTDVTGLTLSGTNIIKITGTAAGASGGTGDISAKMGTITWFGAANN